MPKKKTNKAASKRCHVTATGKVLATKAGKRHLLSSKTRKQKLHLRHKAVMVWLFGALPFSTATHAGYR